MRDFTNQNFGFAVAQNHTENVQEKEENFGGTRNDTVYVYNTRDLSTFEAFQHGRTITHSRVTDCAINHLAGDSHCTLSDLYPPPIQHRVAATRLTVCHITDRELIRVMHLSKQSRIGYSQRQFRLQCTCDE